MNRKTTLYAIILLAWLFLAASLVLGGRPEGLIAIVPAALFWLVGERRRWRWASSLALLIFVLAAMAALWLNANTVLVFLGLVTAVMAWDISSFQRLLANVSKIVQEDKLVSQYYRRLMTVSAVGVVLAILTTVIQINFSFLAALFLGFIAIAGFSLAISFLRRESD